MIIDDGNRDDGNRDRNMVTQAKHPSYFYGYTIIGAGFFIQAVIWGISNSFGVFFDPLIQEFGWSRATISGAASLGFLVHGAASIGIGNLNDRFGPRLIMSVCALFLFSGFFLMGQVTTVWQLYLFYALIASAGLGGADVIPLSTASRWFQKRRSMMSGVIKVGTGVGMLVMPFFITWLILFAGWRHAFMALSGIILVSVVCLSQLLVRDPDRKSQAIDNGSSPGGLNGNRSESGLNFGQAVRARQFWTVCAIYFIILFCVYTILMHIVQHAIDLGIPSGVAAGVLSTIGGVSITGRFLMGWAGDRTGERSALIICLSCLLVSMCWLQAVRTLWMFYVFALVYGFAHGGFFALVSPLVASFFGTKSHGLLYGIVIFSGTAGGAIGPFLAGAMFDATATYQVVFLILSILSGLAIALAVSLKPVLRDHR